MFRLIYSANLNMNEWQLIIILQLSYQKMLRFICFSPLFSFATQGTAASKYIIKSGAYLVEAPPKRPVNSYSLFIKDETSGKKVNIETQGPQFAKKWKLYPQLQQKYTKLAEEKNGGYSKIKEQYQKKYITPFKRVNVSSLRLQHLFKDKKINYKGKAIKEIGNQVKKALAENRTLEGDKLLQQEADKLRAERETLKKQFQFPALRYPTFNIYRLRNSIPELQRTATYEADLKARYEAEVAKWKEDVKKWLADHKYDISIDDFIKLYKKDLKDKKKAKQAKKEEDDDDDE